MSRYVFVDHPEWVEPVFVEPPLEADFDGDRDVDLADYLVLFSCVGLPTEPPDAACLDADLDHDCDVDLADVIEFLPPTNLGDVPC